MSDEIKQMGSLLSKMTAETSGDVNFNDNQVTAIIEVLLPRMVTNLPGMPAGMKCSIEKDDTGWTIRVEKPS